MQHIWCKPLQQIIHLTLKASVFWYSGHAQCCSFRVHRETVFPINSHGKKAAVKSVTYFGMTICIISVWTNDYCIPFPTGNLFSTSSINQTNNNIAHITHPLWNPGSLTSQQIELSITLLYWICFLGFQRWWSRWAPKLGHMVSGNWDQIQNMPWNTHQLQPKEMGASRPSHLLSPTLGNTDAPPPA